jgi:hypothetical protein
MTRAAAFAMVHQARDHAETLRDQGTLRYTSADPDCPDLLRLAALSEELGEVARCIHDNDRDSLTAELAQLAGVAVGWMEALHPIHD